jgi:hypothetical protein
VVPGTPDERSPRRSWRSSLFGAILRVNRLDH